MLIIQRAAERYNGGDAAAGIDTWHAFAFAGFYDPDNLRFGPLTACNEEILAPGAGFAEHPHSDMEIVSWVLEGELAHEDSAGRTELVRAGDLQRLSAGRGVRHVERNAGPGTLRFLQMWLIPGEAGGEPGYEVVRRPLGQDGAPGAARFPVPGADAVLHLWRAAAGGGPGPALPRAPRVYLHVARGAVLLTRPERPEGVRLAAGDAARIGEPADPCEGRLEQTEPGTELLVWELHGTPGPQM
ncbi:pirin-like bicupin family protein [Streptomyces sp. YIM 98790]|uniref:pirin family protein n=1 Tax=Streptomyces sp. YIM 98790 TaxID=2689077 RepID=UPI00140A5073|nr:pirin family protein [Streptomyces sp. YIM 98790]